MGFPLIGSLGDKVRRVLRRPENKNSHPETEQEEILQVPGRLGYTPSPNIPFEFEGNSQA
jgi:hypothetical protein